MVNQTRLHGSEIYLLILLFIIGGLACFFLPISGGYDEEAHLMRVWEMSSFTFLPNEKLGNEMPFPRIYWEMSYRRKPIVRAVESDFWEKYKNLPLDAYDYVYSIKTRSVYSPPLLLPQALVMRYLGRSLQWPALIVYYACRLAGLLSYIFLAWTAVRLIPFGKWIVAIIATSPVAILQAATISPDTISNGIALVFIAGSIAIAKRNNLGWKEWLALVLLFIVLFFGKINTLPLALLPFIVIRPSQFKIRNGYSVLLITVLLVGVIEVLGWNLLAYSRYYEALEGADPVEQLRFILFNPINFLEILASSIWKNLAALFFTSIAIYSFGYWPVPIWTFYLFIGGMLLSPLVKDLDNKPDIRMRISLAVVFVVTYLGTFISLYISFTPVGSESVLGVQGRYLIAFTPLFLLSLAGISIKNLSRFPTLLPAILCGASVLIYISGMYLSYHIPCGSQFYQPGLCYQPNYKNWAVNDHYSEPISEQLALTQEIVSECGGITELRIWVNASKADPAGSTEFILTDINQNQVVKSETVINSNLPNPGWYTLNFPPDWNSDGKQYAIEIREISGGIGPKIAYSLRPEYPDGKLFENDQVIGNDIIFQVGCVAGWEKLKIK